MTGNRVTLITLGVRNLARAKSYYEEIGFVAQDGPPTAVFFKCGTYHFGLFPLSELAKEMHRDPATLGVGAMTLAQNYSDRAGVDAAHARAIEAGAQHLTTPAETFWGGYSGYVADPDGHIWEYAHNPFWPLDEDGHLQ